VTIYTPNAQSEEVLVFLVVLILYIPQ